MHLLFEATLYIVYKIRYIFAQTDLSIRQEGHDGPVTLTWAT